MNKKVIITIIAVILIIVLAVIVGKNLVKDDTNPANTNPVNSATPTPIGDEVTPEPTPETASPEPTETPSDKPIQNVDISKMNTKQKEDYAKSIAKREWEKSGVNTKVYYSYAYIDNKGRYVIAVREEATTNELMWYQIDIKTGTCEKLN